VSFPASISIHDGLCLFSAQDIKTLSSFAEVTHVPSGTEEVTVTPAPPQQKDSGRNLVFSVFTPIPTQKPIPGELQDEMDRAVLSNHDPAINRATDAICAWKKKQPAEQGVVIYDLFLEGKMFRTAQEAISYLMKACGKPIIRQQLPCHIHYGYGPV
jgi:hypothetical protein